MKKPNRPLSKIATAAWTAGVLSALLLLAILAALVPHTTSAPGIDQARVEFRRKNLAEMQTADQAVAETYAWIDPNRGIVRLPVTHAMELSVALNQDPTVGRSNLLSRLEKATAKLPEAPNPYE